MDKAESVLARATSEPVAVELRARIGELAEALFQSIRAQLSVPRYQAIAVERGASFDRLDFPLNDAGFLRSQFARIRKIDSEPKRLHELGEMINRTDPGPGGYYDDLGDPARQPHLVRGPGFAMDAAFYASSLVGFSFRDNGPDRSLPQAWLQHAESLYDAPLVMRYSGLDKDAAYQVRVVYGRERQAARIRLMANGEQEVHNWLMRPFEPLTFDIPRAATSTGVLSLSWTQEPGVGGSGRGCQVAEVWLLRKR
jgi:hypothetical protein